MCAELFKQHIDLWAATLTPYYNALFRTNGGSTHLSEGLITLIFKAGDARILANHRPITLVNKVTSCLAVIFKIRLKPVLGDMTMYDQCSGTVGRHMHESIFKCQDTCAKNRPR
eukprot:SAG31_NODE_17579_length_666_cov_0.513228_1_plen_113_part_10